MAPKYHGVSWQESTVSSPHISSPVPVITARNIPYFPTANRFQTLNLYLPKTTTTTSLIGKVATSLPISNSDLPDWLVHIHGGAWRDPNYTSTSIEPTVAHAFSDIKNGAQLAGIASLNYSLSPTLHQSFQPYDPIRDNHSDPAREAVHPQHVSDVYHGLALLKSLGLKEGSFILSGHSAGACLAFQTAFKPPSHYGLDNVLSAPAPAAILGLNGLYDLEQLVHGLGPTHSHLKDDYNDFLSVAFGADQSLWPAASPARFDVDDLTQRVKDGKAPKLVVLDQSPEDQLVPLNQLDRMAGQMELVSGLTAVRRNKLMGKHAAPWEEGWMIWEAVRDVLAILKAI